LAREKYERLPLKDVRILPTVSSFSERNRSTPAAPGLSSSGCDCYWSCRPGSRLHAPPQNSPSVLGDTKLTVTG
jgi:hypothetical protein